MKKLILIFFIISASSCSGQRNDLNCDCNSVIKEHSKIIHGLQSWSYNDTISKEDMYMWADQVDSLSELINPDCADYMRVVQSRMFVDFFFKRYDAGIIFLETIPDTLFDDVFTKNVMIASFKLRKLNDANHFEMFENLKLETIAELQKYSQSKDSIYVALAIEEINYSIDKDINEIEARINYIKQNPELFYHGAHMMFVSSLQGFISVRKMYKAFSADKKVKNETTMEYINVE